MEIFNENWNEKLKELSVFSENEEYLTHEQKEKIVLEYYDSEVQVNQWSDKYVDVQFYSETTADGYEVYVVTEDIRQINIGSEVYYYKDDLGEQLKDYILNGATIRVEEGLADDIDYEDMITEMYYDHQEEFEELLEDLKDEDDEKSWNCLKDEADE